MLTIVYSIIGILVFLVSAYLLLKLIFDEESADSWDLSTGFLVSLLLLSAAVAGLLWPIVVGIGGFGLGVYYLGKLFLQWKEKGN